MSSVGAYQPVVTDLRAKITRSDVQPGDMLPSESQLIGAYGVSRYSAREAIKRLAADGLIVVVDGRGSHVRARADRARHNDHRGLRRTARTATGRTHPRQPSIPSTANGQTLSLRLLTG
ncbi:MAG: winged helix-turn-helix domain-containing protein [Pseudonocardia sp.]